MTTSTKPRGLTRVAKTVGTGAVISFVAGLALAAPAFATSSANCSSRTDFFKVVSAEGTHCWANAGTVNVNYGGHVTISSGNNAGYVGYYQNPVACNPGQCPGPTLRNFAKFQTIDFGTFPAGGGIVQIHIN